MENMATYMSYDELKPMILDALKIALSKHRGTMAKVKPVTIAKILGLRPYPRALSLIYHAIKEILNDGGGIRVGNSVWRLNGEGCVRHKSRYLILVRAPRA